ncbi:DUF4242 domain-containing protein [soil metagenome]
MSLYLIELPLPAEPEREALFGRIEEASDAAGGELIELQVGVDAGRLYAIVEHDSEEELERSFGEGVGNLAFGLAEVRLVGPSLDEVKAARGDAGYLVEWDLPAGLAMEAYIARKKAKAPGYARVPETTFLRTYVCIDMSKCLCFYRAPDEAAVLRARAAVETPFDRVTRIEEVPQRVRA